MDAYLTHLTETWKSLELSACQFKPTKVVCMRNKMGQVEQCPLTAPFKMKRNLGIAPYFFIPQRNVTYTNLHKRHK